MCGGTNIRLRTAGRGPDTVSWHQYDARRQGPILTIFTTNQNGLLPYNSAHTKLVKRGIVESCLCLVPNKSREHIMPVSFRNQVDRLSDEGYPKSDITQIAEGILISVGKQPQLRESKAKILVGMSYVRKVSHGLKNGGCGHGVEVLFSVPRKLSGLCAATDPKNKSITAYDIKSVKTFVSVSQMSFTRFPCQAGGCT